MAVVILYEFDRELVLIFLLVLNMVCALGLAWQQEVEGRSACTCLVVLFFAMSLFIISFLFFLFYAATLGFRFLAGHSACNSSTLVLWRAGVFFGTAWVAATCILSLRLDDEDSKTPVLFWLIGWGVILVLCRFVFVFCFFYLVSLY